MEHWMTEISHHVALVLEAMALLIIAASSLAAFAGSARLVFGAAATNAEKRGLWLHYARWLIAALTFQLAADLVHSAISPTWDDIGRLAAIAVIRTFLNYFLERDVAEMSTVQRERAEARTKERDAQAALR
jgi:uncharacterized membrane protein